MFIRRIGVTSALNILTQNRVIAPGKAGELMKKYENSGGDEKVIMDFLSMLPQNEIVSAAYRAKRRKKGGE